MTTRPNQTWDIIIVGAGIVGVSLAYHLSHTFSPSSRILVIEKGQLFSTGGTSSHAPGGVTYTPLADPLLHKFSLDSIDLYNSLSSSSSSSSSRPYRAVGFVGVGHTPERESQFRAEMAMYSKNNKNESSSPQFLSPAEMSNLLPFVSEGSYSTALHWPADLPQPMGRLSVTEAITSLAGASRAKGVHFLPHTRVTGLIISPGQKKKKKIIGIRCLGETPEFYAAKIIVCAGAWGKGLLATAGIELRVANVEHQWILSEPLPVLERFSLGGNNNNNIDNNNNNSQSDHQEPLDVCQARATEYPILFDFDGGFYLQQFGDRIGIGSYHHPARLTDPSPEGTAHFEFRAGDFRAAYEKIRKLIPALRVDLEKSPVKLNGLMTYAPDGLPMIGPVEEIEGLWVAECLWVMFAPGAMKALGRWVGEGVKEEALEKCRLCRFEEMTPDEVRRRVGVEYSNRARITPPQLDAIRKILARL